MSYRKYDIEEKLFEEALKIASRTYGTIYKATPASMSNNKGYLIWDFLIYNELTFLNAETGKILSLYHSVLDEKMEIMYYEFAEKYGLSIDAEKKSVSESSRSFLHRARTS